MSIAYPLKRINNEELLNEIEETIIRAEDSIATFAKNVLGTEIEPTVFSLTEPRIIEKGSINWKEFLPLSILESFVVKTGWSETEAIRDLLQNALDANDEAGKPFDVDKNVIQLGDNAFIIDNGPGMPEDAFYQGGTKEGPCERGGFGEGMKIAVGVLIKETRNPVVFLTRQGRVMVANFFQTGGKIGREMTIKATQRYLAVIYGKMDRKLATALRKANVGTAVLIYNSPNVKRLAKSLMPPRTVVFQTKMPPIIEDGKLKGNCLRRYAILRPEGETSKFYIGGLLFHESVDDSSVSYNPTVYSYDLWANPTTGEIERSRKSYKTGGERMMASKLLTLWAEFFKLKPNEAVEAFTEVIEKGLKEVNTKWGTVYVLAENLPGELTPIDYQLTDMNEKLLQELITRAIEKATGIRREKLALFEVDPNQTGQIGEFVYRTRKIPIIYKAKFPKPKIEDMTHALFKAIRETTKSNEALKKLDGSIMQKVLERFLQCLKILPPERIEVHVGYAGILEERGGSILYGTCGVSPTEKRADITVAVLQTDGTPREWKDILKTALHEFAHAWPLFEFGIPTTVEDVSEAFEDALGAVASLVMLRGRECINRALFFTKTPVYVPTEVEEVLRKHNVPFDLLTLHQLGENPYAIAIAVDDTGKIRYSTSAGYVTPKGHLIKPDMLFRENILLLSTTRYSEELIDRWKELSVLYLALKHLPVKGASIVGIGNTTAVAIRKENKRDENQPKFTTEVWLNEKKIMTLKGYSAPKNKMNELLKEIESLLEENRISTFEKQAEPRLKLVQKKEKKKKKGVTLLNWL